MPAPSGTQAAMPKDVQDLLDRWNINLGPIVVSGIGAGAPGTWDKLFREHALDDIIEGKNLIEPVSEEKRRRMLEKNLERVVKSETGNHRIKRLKSIEEVIRLAGQAGEFDISKEFGIRGSVSSLMDRTAQMGLAAGIIALRDAGLPLVRRYKKTTTGSMIPTHWALPEEIGEGTGVIMASAFPGVDSLIDDISRHFADKYSRRPAQEAWEIYDRMIQKISNPEDRKALADWYAEQKKKYPVVGDGEDKTYKFSRSFLFRVLSLGHAQTSQFIGAKGPCTQINAACASTTQAVGIAEDWIRLGRAQRVLIISADDVTNPTLSEWIGTGFLASGAVSTHNVVSETALPFDKRRNGMIIGMGASALVIEDGREPARRGVTPLAELLATQFDNSAFHVTRLNLQHVCETMDKMISKVERRYGLSRKAIAPKMLFMSHETYTPAQGGSSQAEVEALKYTFKEDTPKVIVTNTKGFTGHAMGASLEDVIAIRAMNISKLPPIANYKEADPELAGITLSKGGNYDCEFSLRLGAGFGSQIAMTLMRRIHKAPAPRINEPVYKSWLASASGIPNAETEIVNNTLRVKDPGRDIIAGLAQLPAKPAPTPRIAPVPTVAAAAAHAAQRTPQAAAPTPASSAPVPILRSGTGAAPDRSEVSGVGAGTQVVGGQKGAVTAEIVALVSEKTGYPAEMLELDLDMEADLGIDTVKQAELIGIIREKYDIPRDENLSLKDYPTLGHVIGFVMDGAKANLPEASSTPAPTPVPAAAAPVAQKTAPVAQPAPTQAAPASDAVTAEVVALVSEKTGYPADMLELDLDMEADLGIDTVKQAEL
ncbi:MAG: beta-ketoacyl synthase N-terminal-like domain-containing protein, partial [Elusimicrobiota bacterium]